MVARTTNDYLHITLQANKLHYSKSAINWLRKVSYGYLNLIAPVPAGGAFHKRVTKVFLLFPVCVAAVCQ